LFACRRAVIGLPTSHPSVSYPHREHCSESLLGSKRSMIRWPCIPHQSIATWRATTAKILVNTPGTAVSLRRELLIPKTLSMTMTTLPPLFKQGAGRFVQAGMRTGERKYARLERNIDQKHGQLSEFKQGY
jgi:hypothetical protein